MINFFTFLRSKLLNLTRWSRVLHDMAASQLKDNISRYAGTFVQLGSG